MKSKYEGGELIIENINSEEKFKLNAGEIIIYPSTYLHSVQEIISGMLSNEIPKDELSSPLFYFKILFS